VALGFLEQALFFLVALLELFFHLLSKLVTVVLGEVWQVFPDSHGLRLPWQSYRDGRVLLRLDLVVV